MSYHYEFDFELNCFASIRERVCTFAVRSNPPTVLPTIPIFLSTHPSPFYFDALGFSVTQGPSSFHFERGARLEIYLFAPASLPQLGDLIGEVPIF